MNPRCRTIGSIDEGGFSRLWKAKGHRIVERERMVPQAGEGRGMFLSSEAHGWRKTFAALYFDDVTRFSH